MQAIQTQSEFVAGGGSPEAYAGYVAKRTEELEADVRRAAAAKAKSTIRVRVKAGGWPRGCTHYRVPAKAPFDPRLQPGEPGYEMPFAPEPALALPIGQVSEVPVRDERHLAALKTDALLEFVDDATPTGAEEKALVDAALQHVRNGTPLQVNVQVSAVESFKAEVAAVKAEAEKIVANVRQEADKRIAVLEAKLAEAKSAVGPPDISKLPEAEAIKAIQGAGDALALVGWLKDADTRGVKAVAEAVVKQLDVLGELVGDALKARDEKPVQPVQPPQQPQQTPAKKK